MSRSYYSSVQATVAFWTNKKTEREKHSFFSFSKNDNTKVLYVGSAVLARWGVAEWIERPLLMLEVRGSNPGHYTSKNTTSYPEA